MDQLYRHKCKHCPLTLILCLRPQKNNQRKTDAADEQMCTLFRTHLHIFFAVSLHQTSAAFIFIVYVCVLCGNGLVQFKYDILRSERLSMRECSRRGSQKRLEEMMKWGDIALSLA